jgi:glycosyltransferase involved in cell wall biosynthesis
MTARPVLSLIVPTFNRPQGLARLLRALSLQNFPSRLVEILVVDDGGDRDLAPVLKENGGGLAITLLRQQNRGPAAARNLGAAKANGQCLVFIDDDCEPLPGWLRAVYEAWQAWPDAIGGGPLSDRPGGNLFSQATILLQEYLNRNYNPSDTEGGFFTTNNFWIPAKGFGELGGFDPRMNYAEDRELCYRWTCNQGVFHFVSRAGVVHHKKLDLISFLVLHFRYGQGTALFRTVLAQKSLPRVKLSSPKWYLDLLLYGIRKRPGPEGMALSALILASQAAYTAGILWSKLAKPG